MNGERVGEWGSLRSGTPVFRYAESWASSPRARALSLSLPLTADLEVRGPQVEYYFDNLLPDSPQIRRRIGARFHAPSSSPFDLLSAIGRECVGAVQLLLPNEEPTGWDRIDASPLSETDVEQTLRDVVAPAMLRQDGDTEFRISLAGAQEKTALLRMGQVWHRPRGSTPTTHILKLPLGTIGGFQGDFSDSVENEWLCGQFLRHLGFSVADATMARFGEQRTLVVKRFDRRWLGVDEDEVERKKFRPGRATWIARLPQEDFCQATGQPPSQKYEAGGGPSMAACLALLANSDNSTEDRSVFVLAQLAFWLLAATDGHAKNFSINHRVGATFSMTPLYDVLSAWPIIGHGRNQLPIKKATLAMAVRGARAHYKLGEIQSRHWEALATRTGIPGLWNRMLGLVEGASGAFDRLEKELPEAFPERVFATIRDGVRNQAQRFTRRAATMQAAQRV